MNRVDRWPWRRDRSRDRRYSSPRSLLHASDNGRFSVDIHHGSTPRRLVPAPRRDAQLPASAAGSGTSFGSCPQQCHLLTCFRSAGRLLPVWELPRECDWLFVSVLPRHTVANDTWLSGCPRGLQARSPSWCRTAGRLKSRTEKETHLRCGARMRRTLGGRLLGHAGCTCG